MNTIQQAMSEVLKALGFSQMAKDVLKCEDAETLKRYAQVCVKNSPQSHKASMQATLAKAGLLDFAPIACVPSR